MKLAVDSFMLEKYRILERGDELRLWARLWDVGVGRGKVK